MTFMFTKKVILSLSIASYSHHQSLLFLYIMKKLSLMGHFGQELQPPLECHKSFKPADRFTDQRLVSPKSQQLFGPRGLSNVCCVYLSSLSRSRFTALFTNMRTLKFKSRIHNCVFRCRQSKLRSKATNLETQKHTKLIEIHQSQITNHDLLNPLK